MRPATRIAVPDSDLGDLRDRLARTRWDSGWPEGPSDWSAGIPSARLGQLADRWRTRFDWRSHELRISELPAYEADIDGVTVRFLRFDAPEAGTRLPVLLANGWPSSELELVPLARALSSISETATPRSVVVPSIPGYGFSPCADSLPSVPPTHELFHRVMTQELGYPRYAAHGGDLGAGTVSRLAQAHPESVAAIHLMAAADPTVIEPSTITDDERRYLDAADQWARAEGGYEHEQRTRPATLAAALIDSPVGLLAWMAEKYAMWTDGPPTAMNGITDEFLLLQASYYWLSGSIGVSFRPYWEHYQEMTDRIDRVTVPTAFADFPGDLVHPPASWVGRVYNLVRYTSMPRGGHFAALEETELLAADIGEFLSTVDPIPHSGSTG